MSVLKTVCVWVPGHLPSAQSVRARGARETESREIESGYTPCLIRRFSYNTLQDMHIIGYTALVRRHMMITHERHMIKGSSMRCADFSLGTER